jgi:hypothetical protein
MSQANYQRVIPRDLFNEASLLKCLGRFWIETERFQPKWVKIEHDGEPFDILQDQDGATYVLNVEITINGVTCYAFRPLNSREPWPLWLSIDGDSEPIEVFTESGELTGAVLSLIQGVPA